MDANSSINKKAVWKSIFRLIIPKKKQFLFVVIISLLSTGVSLIEPLIYREAINDIAGIFAKRSSGALSKQINQQEEVSGIVNGFSQQILPEIISLSGIVAIMFWQNVTLTFVSLAIIPLYLLIAVRSANKLESGLANYYERWEEVSALIQDALGGIKTVKLSGAENREVMRFQKAGDGAYSDYIKRSQMAHRYIFWENVLTRISSTLVLGYGGYLAVENKLSPRWIRMFCG